VAAVLLTSLWSTSGAVDSVDVQIRLRVAEQLIAERRLVVAHRGDLSQGPQFRDAAGVFSSRFGIGQSLFLVPFVMLTRPLAAVAPVSDAARMKLNRFLLATSVFAVVLLAIFGLCVVNTRALGADLLSAYAVAFVAVFGSSFWQMAKHGQEENQLAIAVLLALFGFLGWRRTGRPGYVWLSAISVAGALVFRPTAVITFIGVVGLYVVGLLRAHREGTLEARRVAQVAISFAMAGAVALTIILGYNLFKTGHPLRFGYVSGQGGFSASFWWDAMWGSTLGLDRGIIWRNLWLLPAALLVTFNWRRLSPDLRLAVALSGFLFLASVALHSAWSGWATGYGTRFQQHLVPMLALTLLLGVLEPLRGLRRWTPRVAVIFALLAAAVQLPSVMLVHNLEYLQAMTSGAAVGEGQAATAALGGQLRLRHANVFAKLTTGSTAAIDTLRSRRALVPLLVVSSRWDFWPWRLSRYLGPDASRAAKLLWFALLLFSIGAWVVVFRRAADEDHAG
jgi:hypothetical protein